MDQPQTAGSMASPLRTRGVETGPAGAAAEQLISDDLGRGNPGKPVGAVVAAAKVLRTLHNSERPLNASAVARAAGLHRGTAYNILRTLQAEGFVGYDDATRSYSVSLHILEIAYGVLRRSGLMDLARPLMHAVSDAHGVSVYLSKGAGARFHTAVGLGWGRVPHRFVPHRRASVPRPCRRLRGYHCRLWKQQRTGT